jgi:hypothetical protein
MQQGMQNQLQLQLREKKTERKMGMVICFDHGWLAVYGNCFDFLRAYSPRREEQQNFCGKLGWFKRYRHLKLTKIVVSIYRRKAF